jgi:prepilin-type N-terminal cleavage/methylation domain-containing protein
MRNNRGFTLVEVTIVVLVIVILVAVAIPLINNWLAIYRLGIATQQVADGLAATKMRAVAQTRRLELLFDVEGNQLGQEGTTLTPLPDGVTFSTGDIRVPPEEGVEMTGPVTFPPAEGTYGLRAAAFTGRGLPDADPGEVYAVFVTNTAGTRAVVMTSAGNIRAREWTGTEWK